MARPDIDVLRQWLEHVQRKQSTEVLMLAIAHESGIPRDELASMFALTRADIESWFAQLDNRPLPVFIAELEGIDFDELADTAGLSPRTVEDWFAALADEPVDQAADIVRRYSQRASGPLLSGVESMVHYIDYGVLDAKGWSIEDPDLFEKAANADLDLDTYGRFIVPPGHTILDAAERAGRSWPYACRGGACANCAVVIKEGDVAMPGQAILSEQQVRTMNARLTCVGVPVTDVVKLVVNVQQLDALQDLRLPSPMMDTTLRS